MHICSKAFLSRSLRSTWHRFGRNLECSECRKFRRFLKIESFEVLENKLLWHLRSNDYCWVGDPLRGRETGRQLECLIVCVSTFCYSPFFSEFFTTSYKSTDSSLTNTFLTHPIKPLNNLQPNFQNFKFPPTHLPSSPKTTLPSSTALSIILIRTCAASTVTRISPSDSSMRMWCQLLSFSLENSFLEPRLTEINYLLALISLTSKNFNLLILWFNNFHRLKVIDLYSMPIEKWYSDYFLSIVPTNSHQCRRGIRCTELEVNRFSRPVGYLGIGL